MAPRDHVGDRRPGLPGKALGILYVIAGAAPLLAAWATGIEPERRWTELGAGLAMISGAMFFLQFWSSGRFETLSGRVGIDRIMGFHRLAAVAALLIAIAHPIAPLVPIFIEEPHGALLLLGDMLARPRSLSGVLSLAGLVVLVGFALLRTRRGMRYEFWRATHGPLAIVVAGLVLHHALTNGDYSRAPLPRAVWMALGGAALLTFFFRLCPAALAHVATGLGRRLGRAGGRPRLAGHSARTTAAPLSVSRRPVSVADRRAE